MKKRSIIHVRQEIRDLDSAIQHGIVRGDGIALRHPEKVTIQEAKIRIEALKKEYPQLGRKASSNLEQDQKQTRG